MEIVKQLNLNKHPGDVPNNSLIAAKNIKISNDGRTIVNEEGLQDCFVIDDSIHNEGISNYKIVGVIPTNTELVLFIINTDNNKSYIFRYKEDNNTCILVNYNWKYNGGNIKGTFTYNIDNDLIIGIAEYSENGNIPIKTINLDKDSNKNDNRLSVVPKIPICVISDINMIDGFAYKGYYEFYIRYKLDDNNYTQWYYINGKPLLDKTDVTQIMNIGTAEPNKTVDNLITGAVRFGHTDYITDDKDFCNVTLKINYKFSIGEKYDKIQLGYIVTSKSYTKCYRTEDIIANTEATINNLYIVNPKTEIEYSVEDLTMSYYNYVNAKNIINYKNRLYISNYKENNYNIKESDLINNDGSIYNLNSNISLSYVFNNNKSTNYSKRANVIIIDKRSSRLVVDGSHLIYEITKTSNCKLYKDLYVRASDCMSDRILEIKINGTSYNKKDIYFYFLNGEINKIYYSTNEMSVSKEISVPDKIDYTYTGRYTHSSFYNIPQIVNVNETYQIEIDDDEIIRNTILENEVYDFYVHFIDEYGHTTNGIRLSNTNGNFGVFINKEGHKLFKAPTLDKYINIQEHEKESINDSKPGKYYTIDYKHCSLYSNIESLPKGYIGAFISYAKFEKTAILKGIYTDGKIYSGYIDSSDKFNINGNAIHNNYEWVTESSLGINFIKSNEYTNNGIKYNIRENNNSFNKYAIYNKIPLTSDLITEIDKISIIAADSVINSNNGFESYAKVLFKTYDISIGDGMVDICNNSDIKYVNTNKTLIPTSFIAIKINDDIISTYDNYTGYNGFYALDTYIKYNDKGFILNTENGMITGNDGKVVLNQSIESFFIEDLPYEAITTFIQWDYPLHVKRINNSPKAQALVYDNDKTTIESIVEPKNTVDLFRYPHAEKSEIGSNKLFTEYNKDEINVTEYNQTIRRSNIIQDESRINTWRVFPTEGYKNITENKGNITNLIGIGYYLIAHTEHSMFLFDISASLKTQDQDVQLYQPDAFEVDYKEVFTSDKGYGGLQDDKAFILNDFGYIFYNNDFNKIYQFDNGQLKIIGDDIELWLDKYHPYNVRFANDKYNYRLLIKFDYLTENTDPRTRSNNTFNHNEVISYNYKLGKFISLHDYYFNEAWNTKVKCYFQTIHNNDRLNCPLHILTNDINYGRYDTNMGIDSNSLYLVSRQTIDNKIIHNSYIDILINPSYENIKYLEYISYKLRKIYIPYYSENINNPVDIRKHPYSGDILRIFNEEIDTKDIDISVDTINKFNRFKKPVYEQTQWNFNYFRNNIKDHSSVVSDKLKRIYGNYMIVRFIFNNTDNLRIEFESFNPSFSLFRKS